MVTNYGSFDDGQPVILFAPGKALTTSALQEHDSGISSLGQKVDTQRAHLFVPPVHPNAYSVSAFSDDGISNLNYVPSETGSSEGSSVSDLYFHPGEEDFFVNGPPDPSRSRIFDDMEPELVGFEADDTELLQAIKRKDELKQRIARFQWVDITPTSNWEKIDGGIFQESVIVDKTTNFMYLYEHKSTIRKKGLALALLGVPILGTVGTIIEIASAFFRLIGFEDYSDKTRYHQTTRLGDLTRVLFGALTIPARILVAAYTIVCPYNGRKLYSTIERLFHGSESIKHTAPCFQPFAQRHLLGGSTSDPNAW